MFSSIVTDKYDSNSPDYDLFMSRLSIIFCSFILLLSVSILPGNQPENRSIEARAIWITRWDFRNAYDIRRIMHNIADHHFNIVFFQIRGAGSVYYKSTLEPWAWADNPPDSLWDPLETAVRIAHEYGLQLHAWANVYPGWASENLPQNETQLWRAHPDWFMCDIYGERQQLNGSYVWLSPTHPDVQSHLTHLFSELINNYYIDGLHFDYIRYPGSGYSYDPASVALFEQIHRDIPQNLPTKWDQFRRSGITDLIDSVYSTAIRDKPSIALSAATMRNHRMGENLYFQDAHNWISYGLLDFISPMIYTKNADLFHYSLENHLQNIPPAKLYPGIQASDPQQLVHQIELSRQKGCLGHAIFSYRTLFPDHVPGNMAHLLKSAVYKRRAEIPAIQWKDSKKQLVRITDISVQPEFPVAGQEINIQCNTENLPEDKELRLMWNLSQYVENGRSIPMCKQNGDSDVYITCYSIPPQDSGSRLHFRIAAGSNTVLSKIHSVIINNDKSLFRQHSVLPPLIYDAQFVAVDARDRAWICERGRQRVRVIDADGNEAPFSPIIVGLDADNRLQKISNPCGIAIDEKGIVYVTANPARGLVCRFNAFDGTPFTGLKVRFWHGELDVDARGNLFILESGGNRWHVFDQNNQELLHSPITGSHISTGIAVNDSGNRVYVACQADGAVHCWQGDISDGAANFERIAYLPVEAVGMGTVDVDAGGRVYVSHIDDGSVTIFDRHHNFLTTLKGTSPPLRAPRGAGLTADGSSLFIVDWGIESGTQVQVW
ncbi:family 10 glycosylhydrolase, partial [candidate division KSB1 bacterium]|nr:family 10 glycosylhydrolase [candidate division KSB1 bacterium]